MIAGTPPPHPTQALIGRSAQLDQFARCLEQVRAGRGATVVVSGEAGIGKTLLVKQLGNVAACVTGNCYEFAATPPYGPWLEILYALEQISQEPALARQNLPVVDSSVQDQHEIFNRIFQQLESAASRQPLVVILEDMHWADEASVELLQTMSRQVQQHSILLIITYRDDDLHRSSPFYRLLPYLLRDGGAERMQLRRLGQVETNEIVARRYDLDEAGQHRLGTYLQHRAQGNPFFTTELLYALEERHVLEQVNGKWTLAELDEAESRQPVPALVRQVIDGRLQRLSDLARRLLQVASVIGQDVPLALWRSLSDIDEHEFGVGVERVIQARFMLEHEDGLTVSFQHALVREATYLSVVLPNRQRLHRRAGEVLLLDPNPEAERVAYHFARAMDQRATEWLAVAAERALAVCAPYAVIRHCDLALDLSTSLAVNAPVRIHRTRGNAYAMIGDFVRAQKDLSAALERSRADENEQDEWQALLDLGQLWVSRDYARAREYFEIALEKARILEDETRIAHSLNRVGNWFLNDDQPREAIRYQEEALAIFTKQADHQSVAQATDLLGMDLLILGDHISAEQCFRAAVDGFELLDDRIGLSSALGSLITVAGSGGFDHELPARLTPERFEEVRSRSLALARESYWRAGEAGLLCVIGNYHLTRGSYDQALQALEQAAEIAESIEHREWLAYALSGIADTYLDLLDEERARDYAERALASAMAGGSRIHEKGARGSLAKVYLARSDAGSALQILAAASRLDLPTNSSMDRFCRVFQAQAILMDGNPQQALDITDELIAGALPQGDGRIAPILNRLRAETLSKLHRYAEAEEALLAARDLASELRYRPEQWRILIALGQLFAICNRPGDARRSYAEAWTIVEQLARLIPDQASADHFVTAVSTRIPSRSTLTPFQAARQESGGLTPRQRDVAVLVARGWTNSGIANELSISERTVEGHVSAIMTTLDFSSRAQIAAWAVDQQLVTL